MLRTRYVNGWKKRWLLATLTALLTTAMGLGFIGHAESPKTTEYACGLSDALMFQSKITNPKEEADPAYMRRTAENFIAACPDRLERRQAHLIAARGALDSGDGLQAAHHYDSAIARGARLDADTLMDYAVALRVIGENDRSRAIQSSAVATWARRIVDTGVGHLDVIERPSGDIFKVVFDVVDPDKQVSAMWVALPHKGGLPATVLIRPAFKIAAWRAVREGGDAQRLMVAEMNHCREQAILMETFGSMKPADIEPVAVAALEAYVRRPDSVEVTAQGEAIASCMTLSFMLHVPNPQTAVPVRF